MFQYQFMAHVSINNTLSDAKSVYITLQSPKAWDLNFDKCDRAGITKDQLKKFRDQYGGTFYPDSSTYRHTDFYGLPCVPEPTYYYSFDNLK